MAEGSILSDLGRLLEDLKQVTTWFQLGLRLGIDHAELKKIERNYKLEGIERYKAEMLAFWRDNSKDATLRKLVSALKEIGHGNLAKQLLEKYNDIPQTDNSSRPTAQVTDPDNDCSEDFLTKCMIDQLDEEAQQVYADFGIDLLNLFKKKGVSVDDAFYAVAYRTKNESAITSDMREAKDIQEFLLALRGTQSWYDFEVTAYLATKLGGKKGKKLVETYESKLKVHLSKWKDNFEMVKIQKFVMKVDYKQEQFRRIKFHSTVVRLMKLKHNELVLRSVKEGCVELTYLFPSTLTQRLRNAISECINELKELRVISVSIDGEAVWSQTQESEALKHQYLIQGKATAKPKQLRGLLDMATRSKPNLPRPLKTRSVFISDNNHKSKQPYHKLILRTCLNTIKKHARVLTATLLLLMLVFFVMFFSQMLS